jgi:hypothetical protein
MTIKKLYIYFATAAMLLLAGCAALNNMKITRESLDETVRDYQQLIRWDGASSAVVLVSDPMKPAYQEKATGFNRVKIVDYRIKSVDFSKEQKKATVVVEYDYHLKSGLNIKTVVDMQKWEYRETPEPAGWRLTTYPPAFP